MPEPENKGHRPGDAINTFQIPPVGLGKPGTFDASFSVHDQRAWPDHKTAKLSSRWPRGPQKRRARVRAQDLTLQGAEKNVGLPIPGDRFHVWLPCHCAGVTRSPGAQVDECGRQAGSWQKQLGLDGAYADDQGFGPSSAARVRRSGPSGRQAGHYPGRATRSIIRNFQHPDRADNAANPSSLMIQSTSALASQMPCGGWPIGVDNHRAPCQRPGDQ